MGRMTSKLAPSIPIKSTFASEGWAWAMRPEVGGAPSEEQATKTAAMASHPASPGGGNSRNAAMTDVGGADATGKEFSKWSAERSADGGPQ